MVNSYEPLNISRGMDVYGADGEKVGSVEDMRGDYVVVSKGFFFPTDYFIPVSAINTESEGNLYLTVSKHEALNQGWDTEPAATGTVQHEDRIAGAGAPAGSTVDQVEAVDRRDHDQRAGDGDAPFDHTTNLEHRDSAETIDVPLTEEELAARKYEVERGSVQVDKVVRSDEQTLDVPVTEEHVHVSRRAVDRDVKAGEETFNEGTIEVPVYGEEVEVTKNPRVKEVVEISKDATTETQQVSDTVRREEVRISDESGTNVNEGSRRR